MADDAKDAGCCPPGSEPQLAANYVPRGKEITIGGDLLCYEIGESDKGVIVIPDIFGMDLPQGRGGRIRLLADQLADAGFRAILPQVLPNDDGTDGWDGEKKPLPDHMEELMGWLKGYPWEDIKPKIFDKVIPHLKANGVTKIGMIGYCFGAWVNFNASIDSAEILATANCHPSLRLAGLFGTTEVAMAEKTQCPHILLAAGNDPDNVKPGGDVEKALKAKSFGADCIVEEFPEQQHGWVTRGDLTNEKTATDVALATTKCIDFLNKFL